MAIITVTSEFPNPDDKTTPRDRVARFGLLGSNVCSVAIYNNLPESVTLAGCQVAMFINGTAEHVLGPSTATEFTDRNYAGVIQHGNPVDFTTLAAGEKGYFVLENMAAIHSIQIQAKVATGTGKLKIEFGRGKVS